MTHGTMVSRLAIAVAAGACLGAPAMAGTVGCAVGGGTTPAGWTSGGVGGGVAATAAPYIPPGGASTDCYIVTDSGGGYPGLNSTGYSSSAIPAAPNSPYNTIGGTNGSYMASPAFAAAAGQKLNFNFAFITNDGSGSFSDWAASYLLPVNSLGVPTGSPSLNLFTARTGSNSQVVPGYGFSGSPAGLTLTPSTASLQGNTFYLDALTGGTSSLDPNATQYGPTRYPNSGGPGGSAPWVNASFVFNASDAGTYELIMATSNVGDTLYSSGLLFGGQSISTGVLAPEPASLALIGTALAGLGLVSRRKPAHLPKPPESTAKQVE
jgi:hypothetical protein